MGTDEAGTNVVANSDAETVKKVFEILVSRGVDMHTAMAILLEFRDSGILLIEKESK
jgi:hypothetical protein